MKDHRSEQLSYGAADDVIIKCFILYGTPKNRKKFTRKQQVSSLNWDVQPWIFKNFVHGEVT